MDFELLVLGDTGWGDEMLRASLVTLLVSLSAMGIGLLISILGTMAKLSSKFYLRVIADVYTTIIRGVPELLVIYLLFFGGSSAVMRIAKIFGYDGYIELNAFVIGSFAVGAISGAYSTEVMRGAFLAIPKGQIDAGKMVGMNNFLRFKRILVPQVLRYALPGLGNVWQLTLKDTALIMVTGLVEIMRQAHVASGSTYSPFTFYVTAALLYLVLTSGSNKVFSIAESWANRGVRRA